jgi:hypothetical protein
MDYMETDDRFAKLLKMMADPAKAGKRFAHLCRSAGLSLKDVCDLYIDRQRQSGFMRLAGSLPEVMADVGEDAKSKKTPCRACEGSGVAPDTDIPCAECGATGVVRTPGNAQARDLVFETFKFTGQRGPLVAFQQNINNESSSERIEDLFKMTRVIAVGAESKKEGE